MFFSSLVSLLTVLGPQPTSGCRPFTCPISCWVPPPTSHRPHACAPARDREVELDMSPSFSASSQPMVDSCPSRDYSPYTETCLVPGLGVTERLTQADVYRAGHGAANLGQGPQLPCPVPTCRGSTRPCPPHLHARGQVTG